MPKATSMKTEDLDLTSLLESLLFVASGPVPISRLAKVLETSPPVIESLLRSMSDDYKRKGLRIQWSGNEVQLTTAPESSHVVERFLGLEVSTRVTQAALEVLAIVAFMQPTTRPQIDQIRGVNSDSTLRTLLNLGLIEEVGRVDAPGRPVLYTTTPEFLQHFGFSSLDEFQHFHVDEEE